ncbi:uncharacterized protein BDZ83DRAFT_466492 [Colletotrichum acutatum]|uniref:Uncharacterized protein n=1 Tax=Glomerella acutata TaxID=27357 RepID=A0AAD8XCJ6_GLOAC|nr:uncharacterized protein BDZ83DRAFT_466492 [Colletotrichum acutatum]KAK1718861.1 hypothetical protein BDZ83DRAFT_466492 [Colletotrichum acutatum]
MFSPSSNNGPPPQSWPTPIDPSQTVPGMIKSLQLCRKPGTVNSQCTTRPYTAGNGVGLNRVNKAAPVEHTHYGKDVRERRQQVTGSIGPCYLSPRHYHMLTKSSKRSTHNTCGIRRYRANTISSPPSAPTHSPKSRLRQSHRSNWHDTKREGGRAYESPLQ